MNISMRISLDFHNEMVVAFPIFLNEEILKLFSELFETK